MNEKTAEFQASLGSTRLESLKKYIGTCLATIMLAGLASDEAMAATWSHNKCVSQINVLLWYGGCGAKATDKDIAACLKAALANHPECFDEIDQLLASAKTMRKETVPPAQQ